jgi:hypothetical protein
VERNADRNADRHESSPGSLSTDHAADGKT